ncbi:restriction endonuclease [Streptomyces sp. NBC_00670]|jgi:restriction system protein|uniref:restriction endonuclease n=1 Tax=Streptomyces sp. NBC_00670 TaxID=2975804 RepID=UPI002E373EB8|nr:restriction endonuclease [Streptomyces sp. NBC_00670]
MTTTPVRPIRVRRRGRGFDLRRTSLFFVLLALVVVVLGLAARTAARAAADRPVLAVALCLVALPSAAFALRHGRRRFSARRAARRAVTAFDAATTTALDSLTEPAPAAPVTAGSQPAEPAPTGLTLTEPPLAAPEFGPEQPPTPRTELDPDPVQYTAVDYDLLDPDAFEQAVAALCERDGCTEVEVVGGAGDLGADVVGIAPDGRRLVVQCKRYGGTHKVGSQDLQRFGGTCFTVHGAEVAAVVTTSDFTAPAVEYAEQCGILCVDRDTLQAWSDGTGPEPWRLDHRPHPDDHQ